MNRRATKSLALAVASLLLGVWIAAAAAALTSAQAKEPAAEQAAGSAPAGRDDAPTPGQFPRSVQLDGALVVVHPPQILSLIHI